METLNVKGVDITITKHLAPRYYSGKRLTRQPMVEILCIECKKPKVVCLNDVKNNRSLRHRKCRGNIDSKLRNGSLSISEAKLIIAGIWLKRTKSDHLHRGSSILRERTYARDITLLAEDVIDIIFENCYYCGAIPTYTYYNYPIKFNGVDRVDNNLGYIKGNCVACCFICNRAKANMIQKQFLEWIKRAYEYQLRLQSK
jgi:hypothetical protein